VVCLEICAKVAIGSPFHDRLAEFDVVLDPLSDQGIGAIRRELNPSIVASQTTVLPFHYDRHGGCLDGDSPGIARTGVSTTQLSPRTQMPCSFSSQGLAVCGHPALPP
jgi:hypothetical protein